MQDELSAIRIKNFLQLIKEHFKGSINAFAQKFGLNSTHYYLILKGDRPFGDKTAKTIERNLGLKPGQLDLKEGSEEYISAARIPIFANKLSAGNGYTIFDEEVVRYYAVDRHNLQRLGWDEKALCIFEIQGDSMTPKLYEGQYVIVDTSQTIVIDNRIYAIGVGDDIYIKKLFKDMVTHKIIAQSENPDYRDKILGDEDGLKIIGRVIYSLGQQL